TAADGGVDAQVPGDGLQADWRRVEVERIGNQVAALPGVPDAAGQAEGFCVSGNTPGDTGGKQGGTYGTDEEQLHRDGLEAGGSAAGSDGRACQGSNACCGVWQLP